MGTNVIKSNVEESWSTVSIIRMLGTEAESPDEALRNTVVKVQLQDDAGVVMWSADNKDTTTSTSSATSSASKKLMTFKKLWTELCENDSSGINGNRSAHRRLLISMVET